MVLTLPGGQSRILSDRAAAFEAAGTGALSVKCFFGGEARYAAGRARFRVGEGGYLVLNAGTAYTIAIDSPAPVESFCVFFDDAAARAALRALRAGHERLLDDPAPPAGDLPRLAERTHPHDGAVTPALLGMRAALASGRAEPQELAERLLDLAGRLVAADRRAERAAPLSAARPATRAELYRRLHLARDYAEAALAEPIGLADMAGVAGMSPNHLLRTFREAFGQTPHQLLTDLRLRRAARLLETTDMPVTEVCAEVGFSSLGAFSWLFRRRLGASPSEHRRRTR